MTLIFRRKIIDNSIYFLIILVGYGLLASCETNNQATVKKESEFETLFTKISSAQSNITFSNNLIDDATDPNRNVMSYPNYFIGAGVATGDINNDGLVDVFCAGNEVENKLYLNKGDFGFEDISEIAKINVKKKWATGVTMADVNGDGWLDIYVCQTSPFGASSTLRENLLYINNKDNTFTESGTSYGLADGNLGRHASFFDYDLDGDLDCFVLNSSIYVRIPLSQVFEHLEKDKKNLENASSNLYRNDNGKFTKVTESAGVLRYGFGLGVVTSDINNDGYPDIYVANDYSVPDFMYINNGDGTFTDKVKEKTKQLSFYGMGADIADTNNDGLVEIAVVDMASNDHVRDKTLMASMSTENFDIYVNTLGYQHQYMFNSFQLNNGNGTFSNVANLSGLAKTEWSWASLLADFNNDGYKDYLVSNGFKRYARDNDHRIKTEKIRKENNGSVPNELRKKLYDELPQIKLPNFIYENNKDLTFTNKTNEWGLDHPSYSNGATYADLDNDGDLDILVHNIDDEIFVYRNNSVNNYLKVNLKNTSNTINTKVSLYIEDEVLYQELIPSRGYMSCVENRSLSFGLGNHKKIDKLKVIWPDGNFQEIGNVGANQTLDLDYKKANTKYKYNYKNKNAQALVMKELLPNSIGVNFMHTENIFDDFEKEILLPHKQSTLGYKVSCKDLNGDDLADCILCGSKGKSGALYFQTKDNLFTQAQSQIWKSDSRFEDVGSHIFDADGDGDQDIYILSGGGGDLSANNKDLQDRLYLNNGMGDFTRSNQALPKMWNSSSIAKSCDYDKDGDLDLFIGGRGIPGKYPYSERSYILNNDNGKFKDVTADIAPELLSPGLVNDMEWTDFNEDGSHDIVLLGEWMPIMFFENMDSSFKNVTTQKIENSPKGWWYSLELADLDNDGDLDIICGNVGSNTKFKASNDKPFKVFANDFDNNGTCDIVLSKKYKGKDVPTRGKQCSSEQMPFIKDKFPTYHGFANASVQDILGEKLNSALKLQVNEFKSLILENKNGKYVVKYLPNIAQVSPVNGIVVKDLNKDGHLDLILVGNNYDTEIETPRYDAGIGSILMGEGNFNFTNVGPSMSGFYTPHNAKDIALVNEDLLIVANNNGPVQFFKLNNAQEIF